MSEETKGITLEIMKAWQDTPLVVNAWELAARRPWESESTDSQKLPHAQDALASLAQSSFAMGFHAAKDARTDDWIPVSERNPELYGWYEVTVETYSDLGKSRYTLIVSRGHNAELGDVWRVDPNETVIAWKERPLPYGGDK